jgi:hypothetical protein
MIGKREARSASDGLMNWRG